MTEIDHEQAEVLAHKILDHPPYVTQNVTQLFGTASLAGTAYGNLARAYLEALEESRRGDRFRDMELTNAQRVYADMDTSTLLELVAAFMTDARAAINREDEISLAFISGRIAMLRDTVWKRRKRHDV